MAKTYTALGTVAAGDVYTASAYNTMATDVNNFIVPPSVQLIRSTNLTSYTSGTDISWSSAAYDTDSMFSAGSPTLITIGTTGLYQISGQIQLTATATLTTVSLDIYKAGVLWSRVGLANSATSAYGMPSIIADCTAADTFTFRLNITGGSAYLVAGAATETNNQSRVQMSWLGRKA